MKLRPYFCALPLCLVSCAVGGGEKPAGDPEGKPDVAFVTGSLAPRGGGTVPGTVLTGSRTVNASIPDNNPVGVSSALQISDIAAVSSVSVSLDIRHTYVGDLGVTLSHNGVTRTLWNNEGGGADNVIQTFNVAGFAGQLSNGDWTVRVIDNAAQDIGTLVSWRVELKVTAGTGGQVRYTNSTVAAIPDNNVSGVASKILVPVGTIGTRVTAELDIEHTYIADLQVTLAHGTQSWVLHNKTGGSTDNIVGSYALWPTPLDGSVGAWTLTVVDDAALDVGKLKSWNLLVSP